MPRFVVDWMAECDHCGQELERGTCDDRVPEDETFGTGKCSYCAEETCGACRHVAEETIHEDCKKDRDADEEQDAVQEDA